MKIENILSVTGEKELSNRQTIHKKSKDKKEKSSDPIFNILTSLISSIKNEVKKVDEQSGDKKVKSEKVDPDKGSNTKTSLSKEEKKSVLEGLTAFMEGKAHSEIGASKERDDSKILNEDDNEGTKVSVKIPNSEGLALKENTGRKNQVSDAKNDKTARKPDAVNLESTAGIDNKNNNKINRADQNTLNVMNKIDDLDVKSAKDAKNDKTARKPDTVNLESTAGIDNKNNNKINRADQNTLNVMNKIDDLDVKSAKVVQVNKENMTLLENKETKNSLDDNKKAMSKSNLKVSKADILANQNQIKPENTVFTASSAQTSKPLSQNQNVTSANISEIPENQSNIHVKQNHTFKNNSGDTGENSSPDQGKMKFQDIMIKIENGTNNSKADLVQNFKMQVQSPKISEEKKNFDLKNYQDLPQVARQTTQNVVVTKQDVPLNDTNPAFLSNRIAEVLSKAVESQKMPVKIEIQLNPPSLGKIELSLVESGNRSSLNLNVENEKTQELIKSVVPIILDKLSNLNFNVVSVNVNGQAWYQSNADGHGRRQDERERNRFQEETHENFEETLKKEV